MYWANDGVRKPNFPSCLGVVIDIAIYINKIIDAAFVPWKRCV
jgi:hypothetical protein